MTLSNSSVIRGSIATLCLVTVAAGCSDDSTRPRGVSLCVGDTAIAAPPIGGQSDSVSVAACSSSSARLSWQAEESADWFAVTPSSGTTPGWFRIVTEPNPSAAERRDTVFVSVAGAPGIPKAVAVVQGPIGPFLCVSPESYAFATPGGFSTLFAVTNCGNDESIPWIAAWTANWLSATALSGTTPGTFRLSATPNTSGAERSTTITVHDPDEPLLARLLTVTQTFSLFSDRRSYGIPWALSRIGAGDFDRDGDTDIIGSARDRGVFTLLVNSGNGWFAVLDGYGMGPEYFKDLAVADLNGDSYPDLLFSRDPFSVNPLNGNLCFVQNSGASGGFEPGVYALVPGDIVELLVADLDRDGDVDCAYLAQRFGAAKPLLGVLLNKGEASFLGPYEYELMVQPDCGDLGDVDGDGDLDVVLNGEGRFVIMENNGAGSFSWLGNSQKLADARDLALGDFDGDGDPDCAALLPDGHILVMRNLGDGNYNVAAVLPASMEAVELRAADVTGDGLCDIVWSDRFGPQSLVVQKSGGTLIDWLASSYAAYYGVVSLILADIDGDGDLDAAAANGPQRYITVLRNYSR